MAPTRELAVAVEELEVGGVGPPETGRELELRPVPSSPQARQNLPPLKMWRFPAIFAVTMGLRYPADDTSVPITTLSVDCESAASVVHASNTDRIIDRPGAVVTTTTRTGLYQNTAPLRAQHGVLHVFNPERIGGLPSTFRWNPLQGCEHPGVALQRAAA